MKKKISGRSLKALLCIGLVAVLLGVALVLILVTATARDFGLYDLKINGIAAEKRGDAYYVTIPQSKYVTVSATLKDDACKVFCCKDETFSKAQGDLDRVYIGGVDTTLYLAVKEGGEIKRKETVHIENAVPNNDDLSFSVPGAQPQQTEYGYRVLLPYGSAAVDLTGMKFGGNFFCAVYLDEARQNPVEDFGSVPLSGERTVLYVDVRNVNLTGVVRSFTIDVVVEKSGENRVLGLKANGTEASVGESAIYVRIPKARTVELELALSAKAQPKLYRNEEKTDEITDLTKIDIPAGAQSATFYLDIAAENGTLRCYAVTVSFVLENDTSVEYMTANGVRGQIRGNEILFLLDRSTSLTLEAKTASPHASCRFYYDRELSVEVADPKNIDIHDVKETVFQLFCAVAAEDGTVKVYGATVTFIPSAQSELLGMEVNGRSPRFEGGAAELFFEGIIEEFSLRFAQIKVSPGAQFAIYTDPLCVDELTSADSVGLTSPDQSFYIKVVAENQQNESVYQIQIKLISSDNAVNSVTVNHCEYPIISDEVEILLDSTDTIAIQSMNHDEKAQVSLYYDVLQTKPVEDLENVAFQDNRVELYMRAVAENQSVKVYKLNFVVKAAPVVVIHASDVRLAEWQSTVKVSDLFSVGNNDYLAGQFEVKVFWDGVRQNTDFITVPNENKFYELRIEIESPYFSGFSSSKSLEILPYTLRPIRADLRFDHIETKEETVTRQISDLLTVEDGSYAIGRDYYIELWSADNDRTVVVSKDAQIILRGGSYKIYVGAFRNLFEDFKAGELTVTVLEKIKPVITAPDYLEYEVSDRRIDLADLFRIEKNDYEILLVKTFVGGEERAFVTCDAGLYEITLQAYYAGGRVEKTLLLEVASVSDNAGADVFANEQKIDFDAGPVALPDLGYADEFRLEVSNFNSKAAVKALLNGAEISFGALNLPAGQNEIKVIVTAESGRTAEYVLTVRKKERKLPIVETYDATVKLEKNQSYVFFADSYRVVLNDYDGEVRAYQNGVEIFGDVIRVDNINRIYPIEIRVTGEFGTVTGVLNLGVLAFTAVEIDFAPTAISVRPDYVFSGQDFLRGVSYYGIDSALCRTALLLDGAELLSGPLDAGTYYVTVQVWQGELLLKEESVWFTVRHTQEANPVTVSQINRKVIIEHKTVTAAAEDYFTIGYGNYHPSDVKISFIYGDSGAAQSDFRLAAGYNDITLILTDITSGAEIYRGRFGIDCEYIAKSDSVFTRFEIDGRPARVIGNDLILSGVRPAESVTLSFAAAEGMLVYGLPSEVSLLPGRNTLEYFVREGRYSFTAALNIYNLGEIGYYLGGISYQGIPVENKILLLNEGTIFDLDRVSWDFLEPGHITFIKELAALSDTVYDVTVTAAYDEIPVGSYVFRVFIGRQTPRLVEIVAGVRGSRVVSYGINEFGLDLVAVTDGNLVAADLTFSDGKYSGSISFENLVQGENKRSFSVLENGAVEYVYSAVVSVAPKTMLASVTYGGSVVQGENNRFVVPADILAPDKIGYSLTDSAAGLGLVIEGTEVTFNGKIVGYDFRVFYKFVEVNRFWVVAASDNLSVNVIRNGSALAQTGNTLFTDLIEVEKSDTPLPMTLRYLIEPVYPFASPEGEGIAAQEAGYLLTAQLRADELSAVGTFSKEYAFVVRGVLESAQYILRVEVVVTEHPDALVVTANGKQKLYFAQSDLSGGSITARKKLALSIFDRTVDIEVAGSLGYGIYSDGSFHDKATFALSYQGDYYIEFSVGPDAERLTTVRVYVAPCADETGQIVETAVRIGGEEFLFFEEGSTSELSYEGETHLVLTANQTLRAEAGTTEITAECFGYLLEFGGFCFEGGVRGSAGVLKITDGKIVLFFEDGGKRIPYGLINVDFIEHIQYN